MILRDSIETFLEQTGTWSQANTLDAYRRRLERFADFAKDREIGTPLLLAYKAFLGSQTLGPLRQRKRKESTVASHFVTLKLFFNWCVEMELLPKSPISRRLTFIVGPVKRDALTLEERDKIIAYIESKGTDYAFWPDAIKTGWHTGLRLCDVALLKKESLDVGESSIKLIPGKTKRYQRVVHIPVPLELIQRLAARSEGEYVFPEMVEMWARDEHKGLSAQFCYLVRRVGVKRGFHSLRHAAISRWLVEGVIPTMVADMTGLNLDRIMNYTHNDLETKREAMGLNKKDAA